MPIDYRGDVAVQVTREKGYYDFDFGADGHVTVIQGAASVAQAAELRLALWMGGWCLDLEHGFPWLRFVGRKDVTPELMEIWMRKVLARDPRLRQILDVSVTAIDAGRIWNVTWSGEAASGETIRREVALAAP